MKSSSKDDKEVKTSFSGARKQPVKGNHNIELHHEFIQNDELTSYGIPNTRRCSSSRDSPSPVPIARSKTSPRSSPRTLSPASMLHRHSPVPHSCRTPSPHNSCSTRTNQANPHNSTDEQNTHGNLSVRTSSSAFNKPGKQSPVQMTNRLNLVKVVNVGASMSTRAKSPGMESSRFHTRLKKSSSSTTKRARSKSPKPTAQQLHARRLALPNQGLSASVGKTFQKVMNRQSQAEATAESRASIVSPLSVRDQRLEPTSRDLEFLLGHSGVLDAPRKEQEAGVTTGQQCYERPSSPLLMNSRIRSSSWDSPEDKKIESKGNEEDVSLEKLAGMSLEDVFELERVLHTYKEELLRQRIYCSSSNQGEVCKENSVNYGNVGDGGEEAVDGVIHTAERCKSGNCFLDEAEEPLLGKMDFEEYEGNYPMNSGVRAPNFKMFRSNSNGSQCSEEDTSTNSNQRYANLSKSPGNISFVTRAAKQGDQNVLALSAPNPNRSIKAMRKVLVGYEHKSLKEETPFYVSSSSHSAFSRAQAVARPV